MIGGLWSPHSIAKIVGSTSMLAIVIVSWNSLRRQEHFPRNSALNGKDVLDYLWERFHLVQDEKRMSGYFRWQNVTPRFIIKIPYMSSTISPEWNNRINDLLTWYSFRINSKTCLVPINENFYEFRRYNVRAPTRDSSKSTTGTIYKPTILNFKSEQISKNKQINKMPKICVNSPEVVMNGE